MDFVDFNYENFVKKQNRNKKKMFINNQMGRSPVRKKRPTTPEVPWKDNIPRNEWSMKMSHRKWKSSGGNKSAKI